MKAGQKTKKTNGKSKGQDVAQLIQQLLSQQPNSKSFLDRLTAKTKGKGIFGAFAPVEGSCCGACNLSIPTSQLQKVYSGEMINCPTCQRFLYMETVQAA
jgi:predicted  nucleic acid-binding Zn-ribbon protein